MIVQITTDIYQNAPTTDALQRSVRVCYGEGETATVAIAHALSNYRVTATSSVKNVVGFLKTKVVGRNLSALCRLEDGRIEEVQILVNPTIAEALLAEFSPDIK